MPRRRRMPDPQTGTLYCEYHQRRHPSRDFVSYETGHGTVSGFKPSCRDAYAEQRHQDKAADPAYEIIYRRAQERARRSGVSLSFVWDDPKGLGYFALVPYFEAARQPGARCLNCLHEFDDDPGTQLEHRIPPRHAQDWPRLHVRNVWIACKRCNGIKHRKDLDIWLDDEWEHQQAAAAQRERETRPRTLFDDELVDSLF